MTKKLVYFSVHSSNWCSPAKRNYWVSQDSVDTLFRWGEKALHSVRQIYTKYYQNRSGFVEDMTKNILVCSFSVHSEYKRFADVDNPQLNKRLRPWSWCNEIDASIRVSGKASFCQCGSCGYVTGTVRRWGRTAMTPRFHNTDTLMWVCIDAMFASAWPYWSSP